MNETNNTLLIDTSPSGDFLTLDGELVWPVQNEFELIELQKLAKVFGSTIKTVTGQIEKLSSGKEEVVGIGRETQEAAYLYAHLTKRKYRSAENIKDLINDIVPS